jgi:hypothetical protein
VGNPQRDLANAAIQLSHPRPRLRTPSWLVLAAFLAVQPPAHAQTCADPDGTLATLVANTSALCAAIDEEAPSSGTPHVVRVSATETEVEGLIYNSVADAMTHVATQSPSNDDRWVVSVLQNTEEGAFTIPDGVTRKCATSGDIYPSGTMGTLIKSSGVLSGAWITNKGSVDRAIRCRTRCFSSGFQAPTSTTRGW